MTPGVVAAESAPSRAGEFAGYAATFLLGVYDGFFSGGYVTLLTAAYVALFRMTFIGAVSTTKLINVFSSSAATVIFMRRSLVEYRLGATLGGAAFVGATVGTPVSSKMNDLCLRRVFLTSVVALALKMLFYDFVWKVVMYGRVIDASRRLTIGSTELAIKRFCTR